MYQFLDHFFGRKNVFKILGHDRKRFFSNLRKNMEAGGEGTLRQIDRRKDLSLHEFREKYLKPGIPVIFDGAAKNWDCCKKWSLDYFEELHGDDRIVIANTKKMQNSYRELTLREVIQQIKKGTNEYYRFYPLLERHPEHIRDFDYKWLRERKNNFSLFEAFQVFIGAKNTDTPLHNANQGNLFVQAYGEKHWMMYPNYYVPVIDPEPIRNVYRNAHYKTEKGPFDPFTLNYEPHYKLFRYIDCFEAYLRPGDVLWNPPFYWHAVKNPTDSIGVGYRWLAPLHAFSVSPLYALLDTFATNPPIWKSYRLYKQDINLIHLAEYNQLDKYIEAQKAKKL